MSVPVSVRELFPVTKRCTYFDVAYDCGGCLLGRAAAQRFFDDWEVSASENERGGPGRGVFFRELDEAREYLNELVGGTGPQQIAFARNTNEGINALLQGFDFREGDNIVTDAGEHQSVIMPCVNAGQFKGIEVRALPEREDRKIFAEDLIALADEHTRIIAVSHVQSATGWCMDLARLGAWCREHGVFLIVDAIQSLGIKPFRAEEWGVDAVAAGSYKGLCGSESAGFVYADRALLEHVTPVYSAAGFISKLNREPGLSVSYSDPGAAKKLENSTLDNLGGYVLHDSVRFLLDLGIENIWEHVNGIYHYLYDGFRALGLEILSSEDDAEHAGSLLLKGTGTEKSLGDLFDFLRSRNICLSFSHGFIRVSIGVFNTPGDADILLAAVKEFLAA
ncbi:MAG: aminotransferase class V-fold PLP-dependent enzyme [Firmicutes bacterium]|nr:aminotransferase class V-fold PLP-dependent enzyme [Bacillota bacterium]